MYRFVPFVNARLRAWLLPMACVLVFPALAHAQASLAGTVSDASGAVLPGVTVEAASPVLIEKVRTAITDGSGQYRIIDLRPGTYTLTFSLPGFSTVVRDNLQIGGAQTISINAEMRVGGVQETITVTGETPVVDVQSTRRQATIEGATVNTIPIARGYGNVLATVPGIQLSGAGAVTSSTGLAPSFFTSNGGRSNEGRIQIAGMNVGSSFNGGGVAAYAYPVAETQEIQVTVSGGLGEADTGGPSMNLIPREGGNTFSGSLFTSNAGDWSQGSNIDDELRGFGINEPPALVNSWDTSFSLGGPIVRDRIWFYGVARDLATITRVANGRENLNAGDPSSWVANLDPDSEVRSADSKRQYAIRVTGQLTPRNKIGFYHDYNFTCTGSSFAMNAEGKGACRPRGEDWIALGGSTTAPETGSGWDDREKIVQLTYSSPVTNRMLIDGGYSTFISAWGGQVPAGALTNFVPVQEQSSYYGFANYTYRGLNTRSSNDQMPNTWRGSLSYVTGAHNFKFGTQGAYHIQKAFSDVGTGLAYRFNSPCTLNAGVAAGTACNQSTGTIVPTPNQFTISLPNYQSNRTTFHALYAQDQWTVDRLTIQGALRYEWAKSWHPEGENGIPYDSPYARAFSDPRTEGVRGYHDISPRMGVAYDVFGTGKTAVRVNLGHYLQSANNEANYVVNNPASTRQTNASRTWTDRDRDFVVDCDPLNFALQDAAGGDFCGAVTGNGLNFGQTVRTTNVNPDILEGWGKRPYDWTFTASIQQEIIPRLSVEVAYNRRWWGNFYYTDNLNLGPADFDEVTITAPSHPDLPDGGGYPVTFRIPNRNAALNGYTTSEDDFGTNEIRRYNSVDVNANARTAWGLVLQGGTSTGRGVRDTCEIDAVLPENAVGRVDDCHVTEDWLTTLRGLASYTVPKVDVLVSAVMRSQPGTQASGAPGSAGGSLAANYTVPNSVIFAALGRNLLGNAANTTVNLLAPGELYQTRVNSFDMRFAKILRFGGTRADVGVDLYNIINANTQTGYNQTFGTDGATWLRPTSIMSPRFVRFNVRFDF
jgi:hypothetical protein